MKRKILEIILYFSFLHLTYSASLFADSNKCKKRTGNFPKAGSLCRSYYKCSNWIPEEIECPRGEHFFPEKGYCVHPEMYPCFEKPIAKECPLPNGKFLKPNSACKIYYDCCNGVPQEKTCASGLLFSQERRTCDWKEFVTCPEGVKTTKGTVLQPTTTPEIITTLETTITNKNIITSSVFPKSSVSITSSTDSDENSSEEEVSSTKIKMRPTTPGISTSSSDSSEEGNSSEEELKQSSTISKSTFTTPKISTTSAYSTVEKIITDVLSSSSNAFTAENHGVSSTNSPDEKIITDVLSSSSSVFTAEDHGTSSTNSPDEKIITDVLSSSSSVFTAEDHGTSSTNSPDEKIFTDALSSSSRIFTEKDHETSLLSTKESSELPITTIDLTKISATTESQAKQTTVKTQRSSTIESKTEILKETFTYPEITSKVASPVTASFEDEDIGSTTKVTVHIFCPHSDGYFPHPNDKHKFIACIGGDPIIMDCPANLVYDHEKRSCEYE